MSQPLPSPSRGAEDEHDQPLLTLAWSVLAARVGNITIPDLGGVDEDDVDLLVCVQGDLGTELPAAARWIQVDGVGVARSRNAAIANARGRYLMFCDDDITIALDGAMATVRHLERTGKALALGAAIDLEGRARKNYPTQPRRLTLLNAAKAATYEMVLDVEATRSRSLRFDVRFGAGADLPLGDEYIFIADLLRAGLRADAVHWVLASHPVDSSGHRWGTPEDAHHRAAVLNRVFGLWAPVIRPLFAAKHLTQLGGLRAAGRFALGRTKGAVRCPFSSDPASSP